MKIKFDSTQQYQIDAVNSMVDIFDGQPLNNGDFAIVESVDFLGSQIQTELGIGNNLMLSEEAILKNIQTIQEKYDLDITTEKEFRLNEFNFSVEMETGTGKTYVYLRTIFEMSQKYGFKKFIIVVPSVAIREGTKKNIEITEEHFRALFNNIEFEYFLYDSKKANRLRQFATSNQIQIMIINIDAFRKDFSDSEDDKKSNVIYKESDKLSGRKPIEFVQATKPIVIIDEPQSVDNTPKAQEAIKSLQPLCTLRYSATHKNAYNLLYKLDPIKAFELKLVKQIVVASVQGANSNNDAYVKLVKTDNKNGISAEIVIHQNNNNGGVTEKKIKVKQGADLYELSNNRELYKTGYEITDISAEPGNEYIDFSNGRSLAMGLEIGGIKEDLMEIQIRNTIQRHLDKELQVQAKGIKVLSLFFIDAVKNYRFYDEEGKPQQGKFAIWFEKHYNELIILPKYQSLNIHPLNKIHDGYFSIDKKGVFKDTNGATKDDDDTYAKIMRNKEQLLSLDEPLKFIFSHSALREGWDNPNVFIICTLNESRSAMKKRQEIGRGLRLPVNQEGERVFDESINKLLIVANESYDDFARALQTEYEDDCGVTFGKIPTTGFSKLLRIIDGQEQSLGREISENIFKKLKTNGFIDEKGKIQPTFNPQKANFTLNLGEELQDLEAEIIATLETYQLERHIKKDEEPKALIFKKRIELDEDFKALWDKIKFKTTYNVDYKTEDLIGNSIKEIKLMERIEPVSVTYREAKLEIDVSGIEVNETLVKYHKMKYEGAIPDIISYLQKETELTRKTLVSIISGSGRVNEFLVNPQKYMDGLASIIKKELHRLMIDGIKYEKLTTGDVEWSMQLFKDREILTYLNDRLEVNKSVYDAIKYDSDIERKFAEALDKRDDIRLFLKLPNWFRVETPIGEYNPDWAIVKQNDETIYLVRETKSTKNFEKLRNSESDKIKCGRRHFEALETDFDVVIEAGEF
jgi:type III restriction enzyme